LARDLRLFYLFRLLATSYLWMPISVTFMQGRGLSFYQVAWLEALFSGVIILVEVPTGALADRIGRRVTMTSGALAMVVACFLSYFAHGFAQFAAASALGALSMALCSGADSAYLFDLLHDHGRGHEYPRREGVASAWHLCGLALAFAIGGLIGEVDLGLPYLATAGVAGMAFAVAMLLREDGGRRRAPTRSLPDEVGQYLRLIGRAMGDLPKNRRLLWIMGYSAVVFTLLKVTIVLYQPYLDSRGFSLVGRGLVFAGIHVVAALVALRTDWLRRLVGEDVLLWTVLGVLAVSFLLLDALTGPWTLALLAVQAVATGIYSPLVKPIINRETSDSGRRATVLSIESMMRRAGMLVFLPIAGVFGPSSAMVLCAAVGFGGGLLLALTARPRQVRVPVSAMPQED
jgi:MFS family permease